MSNDNNLDRWGEEGLLPPAEDTLDSLSRKQGDSVNTAENDYSDGREVFEFESSARTDWDMNDSAIGKYGDLTYTDWKRLLKWQRGTQNNWNGHVMESHVHQSERYMYSDKKRIAASICDSVGVNPGEKKLIVGLSPHVDYQALGGHSSLEKGILGLVAAVTSSRRSAYARLSTDSPERTFDQQAIWRQDPFRKVMRSTGLDNSGLMAIRKQIYEQFPSMSDLTPWSQ